VQDSRTMMGTSQGFPVGRFAVATCLFTICFIGAAVSQGRRATAEGEDSYFPLAVGNWWLYNLGGDPQVAGKTKKWWVTDSAISNGKRYYVLSPIPPFGDDAPWTLSPVQDGIQELDERFVLRYPVHMGDRWSYNSRPYGANGKLDEFEVVSAGKPCSAGGHWFRDCVTVREIEEGLKIFSLTTYARAIGPVKFVYSKDVHFKKIDWTLTIRTWDVRGGKQRSKSPTTPSRGSYRVDRRSTE
jgi:hypothetical protein